MNLKNHNSKFEELVNKILKESLYGGSASTSPTKLQPQTPPSIDPQAQATDTQILTKQIDVAKKETEEAKKQAEELKKQRKDLEDYQKKMVAIQAQMASKPLPQAGATSQVNPAANSNAPISGPNVQQVIQNLLNMSKTM